MAYSALFSAGKVAFDYAYPGEACNTVFIAAPFRLDGLRLRQGAKVRGKA